LIYKAKQAKMKYMTFFKTTHKDKNTKARTGIIKTDHGVIKTPTFMPVGTQGTVKTIDQTDLKNLNAQIILGNTYHLHLRPNEDLIDKAGGLHNFMNWDKPILTDSGGFQVFSLGKQKEKKQDKKNNEKLVKINDKGVEFRSHIDGSKHFFSPETAIKIQHKIGADIIMAFDECTPDDAPAKYIKEAMDRTHRWANESLSAHKKETDRHGYKQFLFGIIQGANNKNLRIESAKFISNLDFDGIAVGGESIGYNMTATKKILDWIHPYIPEDKPHYAMGLGLNPGDLFEVIEHGIDMFDCVAPTRLARHGSVYIYDKKNKHRLDISKAKYKKDFSPIDKNCSCPVCQNYSRAYIHHLFSAGEITGMRLATLHNLHFFLNLGEQIRQAIKNDEFKKLKRKWV